MTVTTNSFEPTVPTDQIVDVFKKWHTYGLIKVSYWHRNDKGELVEKVVIDIGDIDPSTANKTLKSATKCYIPLYPFLAYLRAEVNDNVEYVIPKYAATNNVGAQTGYSVFGGSSTKTQEVVSRVWKSTYWKGRDNVVDTTARAFKCAQFAGKRNAQGAVEPDYSKPISNNMVKLTMFDLAELLERLEMVVLSQRISADMSTIATKLVDDVLEDV